MKSLPLDRERCHYDVTGYPIDFENRCMRRARWVLESPTHGKHENFARSTPIMERHGWKNRVEFK
jgi:hypothetical protein